MKKIKHTRDGRIDKRRRIKGHCPESSLRKREGEIAFKGWTGCQVWVQGWRVDWQQTVQSHRAVTAYIGPVLNLDQTLLWLWITASCWLCCGFTPTMKTIRLQRGKAQERLKTRTPKITTLFFLYHATTRLIPLVFTHNGATKRKGTTRGSLYLDNELSRLCDRQMPSEGNRWVKTECRTSFSAFWRLGFNDDTKRWFSMDTKGQGRTGGSRDTIQEIQKNNI